MKPRLLSAFLVAAIACAACGVLMVSTPLNSASFGWSAYSPLASTGYQPLDPTWATWTPKVGLVLLALGAGSTGALVAALVLDRSSRSRDPRRTASAKKQGSFDRR